MAKFKSTADVKVPENLVGQVIGQKKAVEIIKKAAKQRRNVLLIGEPGCLVADERVVLSDGTIAKIGELGERHLQPINIKVQVGRGRKTDVATVFHAYHNQPVMEIVTASGKSIKGTYNHPVLMATKRYIGKRGFKFRNSRTQQLISGVSDYYKPSSEWRRLDEIKVGDRVAVVSGITCVKKGYIDTGFSAITRKKFGPKFMGELPDKMTPDLGALFGYIIGDGWVDSNRERLGFVVAEDEKEILPQLISFVKENFRIEPPINRRIGAGRKVALYYADISNKDIYYNLRFLREKRIPNLVFQSGNEVAKEFLKWLFTADGTVYNGGRGRNGINLKSINPELLRDVQTLLLRFGIHSGIIGMYSTSKNAPQLAIRRGHDITKFKEKIGFACQKKIKILDELSKDAVKFARVKNGKSEKVVRIIKGGAADVFDIEVPKGHRFIANGIVSHNTGKTMLAQAMAELLPTTELEDILTYRNPNDENEPLVKVVKTYPNYKPGEKLGDGQGRLILQKERMRNRMSLNRGNNVITPIIMALVIIVFAISLSGLIKGYEIIVLAALILGILIFGSVMIFIGGLAKRVGLPGSMGDSNEPKLIVDNTGLTHAPFIDATGTKAGALFGDIKHDPLQSGGLGTPAHLRVESGAVHKANKGVLYIDEVSNLDPKAQQELLTSLQEKKCPITGQSEMSSGALVKTEPVPSDFVLVAAGNLQDLQHMHPALRSRIRGYGYEVYMESTIEDNKANRGLLTQFIAQEVRKDGKIPHFDAGAVDEIIEEARKRSGRKRRLTLVLRDLGGLVRAAGDLAIERKRELVTREDVVDAKAFAASIEAQVVSQELEYRKGYDVFKVGGYSIGKVNGLAVIGTRSTYSGVVIPIVAEVTPAGSRAEGKFIPTGRLGKTATEAVKNVSAIIKKHMGKDTANYDMHVQFLQIEGVEGDSASISVAVSIISAMENVPVDQSIAMTGSLSVRGEVLPVGGVTYKVEAAINAGIKAVILPASNKEDVSLSKDKLRKIKLIPVKTLADVLKYALKSGASKDAMIKELRGYEGK
jgi:Lon-like ATP-dependent protease